MTQRLSIRGGEGKAGESSGGNRALVFASVKSEIFQSPGLLVAFPVSIGSVFRHVVYAKCGSPKEASEV